MYYSIYYINLDQLFQKVNIPKAISGHMHVFDTILEHVFWNAISQWPKSL